MNVQAFLDTLPIMLYGMIGIFAVILLIYFMIFLVGKIKDKQ